MVVTQYIFNNGIKDSALSQMHINGATNQRMRTIIPVRIIFKPREAVVIFA